jgi:hypothetical protein
MLHFSSYEFKPSELFFYITVYTSCKRIPNFSDYGSGSLLHFTLFLLFSVYSEYIISKVIRSDTNDVLPNIIFIRHSIRMSEPFEL